MAVAMDGNVYVITKDDDNECCGGKSVCGVALTKESADKFIKISLIEDGKIFKQKYPRYIGNIDSHLLDYYIEVWPLIIGINNEDAKQSG